MSFSEMLFLAFIGYVLLGPKKTSELARQIGQHVTQVKRAASELQEQLFVDPPPPEIVSGDSIDGTRQTIVGVLAPGMKVKEHTSDETAILPVPAAADRLTRDLLAGASCIPAVD